VVSIGPVVLRSRAVCTNSLPVLRNRVRPAPPAPWRDGRSGGPDRRGSIEGRTGNRPGRTKGTGRPGDAGRGPPAYVDAKGQEVACATTQGTLSSH
jgi:hypothetical protein